MRPRCCKDLEDEPPARAAAWDSEVSRATAASPTTAGTPGDRADTPLGRAGTPLGRASTVSSRECCRAATLRSAGSSYNTNTPTSLPSSQCWRARIWVPLIGATIVWQGGIFLASDDACTARLIVDTPDHAYTGVPKLEYWILDKPFLVVVPWASAVLLGVVLDSGGRFDKFSQLHVWTRRWAWSSMVYGVTRPLVGLADCSAPGSRRSQLGMVAQAAGMVSQVFSQGVAAHLAMLKLEDLRQWHALQRCWRLFCCTIASFALFVAVLVTGVVLEHPMGALAFDWGVRLSLVLMVASFALGMMVAGQGMHDAAKRAMAAVLKREQRGQGEKKYLKRAINWTKATAVLTLTSGLVSATFFVLLVLPGETARQLALAWLVVDHIVNCFQTALLSGLLVVTFYKTASQAFEQVVDLGTAIGVSGRVSFNGKVSKESDKCVVSFPGIYAAQWERVTSMQDELFSVACVFLTSVEEGLGQHSVDPDNPEGGCYCHRIYPRFPASEYLRVVPRPQNGADVSKCKDGLDFARADAAAMGVHLFVEAEHPKGMQGRALRNAQRKAESLCESNDGRAPWGCRWFEVWADNVERAVEAGQELVVFYKVGAKGRGKLPWEDLPSLEKIQSAAQGSGLGLSQRVEVAYLDRRGFSYKEMSVDGLGLLMGKITEDECLSDHSPSIRGDPVPASTPAGVVVLIDGAAA